ncbi:MAG: energy-coupling factor transporter transmembrane protein EcfT [Desulfotomaculum sp.]|nr:energy-coupling factor transporter transmembrane protein EcfT [Desulfotomaculum sp.]
MLGQITLGQFIPGQSFIHQLNPVSKIMIILISGTGILIAPGLTGLTVSAVYVLIIMLCIGKLALFTLRGLRLLWIIMLFTFFFHALTVPGDPAISFVYFDITWQGLEKAALIMGKLLLVVLLISTLTVTTSPVALTHGLEQLLNPFKRVGVPAHELAMMTSIALRFIPTIAIEADIIIKAQQSRGADFTRGNPVNRIKALIPFMVPLLAGSLRRAEELAIAMEARCYRGGINRTVMCPLLMGAKDYLALSLATFFLVGAIVQRWISW